MDRVKLGVIGAGLMGGLHARVASETHLADVVAVADVDANRADALAARHNANSYTDYRPMLDEAKLDAVVVATPEDYHRDPVVAAAEYGCHVLVEKPIARTLEDADAMIDVCDTCGVKLMVGYILRFEAAYVKLKEAVAAGTLGPLLAAYGRRNTIIQESRRMGGRTSVINYLAVHDIDQILWYNAGHQVHKVFAKAIEDRVFSESGVPDYSWIMFEFDNGSLGIVESGWGLCEKWKDWHEPEGWRGFGHVTMNVVGSRGTANLDFQPMNVYAVDLKEGWKFPETRHWPIVNGKVGGAAHLEMLHFLECVLFNQDPLIDGREGRCSLEVAVAAERSIAEGREIDLPL